MRLASFRDACAKRWNGTLAPFRRRHIAVSLVLSVGIVLSVLLFVLVREWELEQSSHLFDEDASELASQLERSLISDQQVIASIGDMFAANGAVDRREFRVFAAGALARDPHIQALEWVPRVPLSQRTQYENAARSDGYPGFQFTERSAQGQIVPAGPRQEYFPVYYIEPVAGNEAALGYDLGSTSVRLEALQRACDTGVLTATARTTLVQETGEQFGFLLFLPVYGHGVSRVPPAEQRRESLRGFAVGVFRIGDLVQRSLGNLNESRYTVTLYDESAPPGEQLLYASDPQYREGLVGSGLQESFGFDVGGRKWSLRVHSRSAGAAEEPISLAFGAAAAGLLITIALAAYLHTALGRATELSAINVKLQEEVSERKLAEDALLRTNRALRTISEFNQSLVRVSSEPALLESICRVAVDPGGYRMAWVGIAEHDEARTIRPAAWAGFEDGYLESASISWADDEYGRGATGTAIRTGRVCVVRNALRDPAALPWAAEMARRGYASSIALPLITGSERLGALNLYASGPDAFDEEEVQLLTELSADLAYGLTALRTESERGRVQAALRESEERFRSVVQTAREVIVCLDSQGAIVLWSRGAETILGYSSEEVVGKSGTMVLPERLRDSYLDGIEQIATSGGETTEIEKPIETLGLRKDGSEVPLEVTLAPWTTGERSFFTVIARDISGRKAAEAALRKSTERLRRALEQAIQAMAAASEMRDPYTAGHQRRTARLAVAIAQEMGLPADEIDGIRMAAQVHDVGKISVPAEILSKPGRLSHLEFSLIKAHPQAGYEILKGIEFPRPIAGMVLQHHERMDGSGYPFGLAAEDIIPGARILAVADLVEAMASHRPYRPARGLDEALREISEHRGMLYDPEVVDACLRVFAGGSFAFE